MINGFKVITLCGSTRFKDEFIEVQKRLTLEGNIVISVGLFGHSGDEEVWNEGVKEMLDRQHLAKIDLADEIFIINVGGYIGESTRREIAYAKSKHKAVSYLENKLMYGVIGFYSALSKLHELGRLTDEELKRLSTRMRKKCSWPLRSIMSAKDLGLINGTISMPLYVAYCNSIPSYRLITMT